MKLISSLSEFFSTYGYDKKYWLAYSGGLDSRVLLSICHQLSQALPIKLHVIHVNHHISKNANDWAIHCEQVCRDYGILFTEKSLQLNLNVGDSIEEIARNKRYQLLADCMLENDILLTAHHQDDQAETMLLQLCRGSGPKGLAAMPIIKSFAKGFHARPLLNFSRDDLLQYAKENNLQWIEDESNLDNKMTRNFIRHEVLSLLKNRWPSITNTISRSANYCAEAQDLLEEFAAENLEKVRGRRDNTLSVKQLLNLDNARQKLLLRLWIQQQGHSLPHTKKLLTIQSDVLNASLDAAPCVAWADTELRRHRDDVFLMKIFITHDDKKYYEWDLLAPLIVPGIGELIAVKQHHHTKLQNLTVRFRQGGEVVDLGVRGHHTLRNLMQEWDVLPWLRNRIPLIFVDEKLVCVLGYFKDETVLAGWDIHCK